MPSTSKPLSTATKVHREIPSERLWYERRGTQYLRFDRKGTFDNAGIGKLLYGICIRKYHIWFFLSSLMRTSVFHLRENFKVSNLAI